MNEESETENAEDQKRPPDSSHADPKDAQKAGKSLHVNPVGENWEVESDTGTLGQTETKAEAVELARELAVEAGAGKIEIHTSDGQVEKQIQVGNEPR